MENLTNKQKIKKILDFLIIIFGKEINLSNRIMKIPTKYLIEKFERYILSKKHESDDRIHPLLKYKIFYKDCIKYGLKITSYEDYENLILNCMKVKEELK